MNLEKILDHLPPWSQTLDPNYQFNYERLKKSVIEFTDSLNVFESSFQLTEQSLTDLAQAGIPDEVIRQLKLIDPTKVYAQDEFLVTLQATIGNEQATFYQTLLLKYTQLLRNGIKTYSTQYCFPKFSLPRASAFYLFLRIIFDLPVSYPRGEAQTFGGWLHPSIPSEGITVLDFNLSWPVTLNSDEKLLVIDEFSGYFGKGYDAIGEYEYFRSRFPFRNKELFEEFTFVSSTDQAEQQ